MKVHDDLVLLQGTAGDRMRLSGIVVDGVEIQQVVEIDVSAEPAITRIRVTTEHFTRSFRTMPRDQWERLKIAHELNIAGSKR